MMKSDMNKDTRAKKGRSKKKRLLWFLLIPLLIIALGAGDTPSIYTVKQNQF